MLDYDSPWKEMLEGYFPDFMAFFFPKAYQDIDWPKGYESLDKELQQIVRDAELGKRLADKLIKVWRLDGKEQIVLIHTEIQASYDQAFAKRMYTYNYRLFDRYDRPIVSLAVLGDDSKTWRPDNYYHTLWGCEVGIRFPIVKLVDYNERWKALEVNDNPFATVVMAHLKTRATANDPENRYRWKMQLVRRLYHHGYQRKDILELFRFIDWVLILPPELEKQFWDELEQYEEEAKMPYVTSVERIGIEKGIQRGIQQGEHHLLKRLLKKRFPNLPNWVEEKLEQASQEDYEKWADRILDAQHLEDIFKP